MSFRTAGDATGQDPFMIEPDSIIGKQSLTIPLAGYLVMYPQSRHGWIFVAGIIILYVLYLGSGHISRRFKSLREKIVGISAEDLNVSQQNLEEKISSMNEKVVDSMNSFSEAMSEYARHIASHTAAVKSLARAAAHLEKAASGHGEQLSGMEFDPSKSLSDEARLRTPVKVTPELKAALVEFLRGYAREHNLQSLQITPELRKAVWNFIIHYYAGVDQGEEENLPSRRDKITTGSRS
jgi:hypothetical protein